MTRLRSIGKVLLLSLLMLWGSSASTAQPNLFEIYKLVDDSRLTFARFAARPQMDWFRRALPKAKGIFIAPDFAEGSFLVGAGAGNAVLLTRDAETGKWSEPAFYSVRSGTLGFQLGVARHAIVVLIMTDKGLERALHSTFFLGGGMSIAAGPVGATGDVRNANTSDFVGYGLSKGALVSAAVAGSTLTIKNDWHELYHGLPVTPEEVASQDIVPNWYSARLRKALSDVVGEYTE